MAQRMTRSPRCGSVAETGRFVTADVLNTSSCFCASLPSSFFFFYLRPCSGIVLFFVLLRPYSSHLLHVSKYVCTSGVICIPPYLRLPFVLFVQHLLIVSAGVFVVLSYPVR